METNVVSKMKLEISTQSLESLRHFAMVELESGWFFPVALSTDTLGYQGQSC